ncbi:hypothetical protein [Peribacillus muralis]
MSVVGVRNVGPSLAVNHNGNVLVQGILNKEEMLFITLNRRS